MARLHNHPETDKTYAAAQRWVDAALRSDDSLFTPGSRIWSPEVIDDLWERFVEHPDPSSDDFLTKFKRQLAGEDPADPATIQLAGEVLFFHFLIATDVKGTTKREVIDKVLSWSIEPVSTPPDLVGALDVGIARGGTGLGVQRADYLRYLLEFTRTWKRLPEARRDDALRDPWVFKDLAYEIDGTRAWGQREALLHLVFPNSFERIISRDAKEHVADKFRSQIADPDPDQDKLLLQIRRQFEENGAYREVEDAHILWSPVDEPRDTTPWGRFIYWAKLFYDRPDFDEEERDYKLEVAERLRLTKDHLFKGDDGWLTELGEAFGPRNNLTDRSNHAPFLQWCHAQPDAAAQVLKRFWSADTDVAVSIDRFFTDLPKEAQRGSPLPIASLLLSALRPDEWPVCRYKPLRLGCKLTGSAASGTDDGGALYNAALGFWDDLIKEAARRGLDLRDRLDAQSVAWCVTMNKPKPDWPDEQKLAFLAYRDGEAPSDGGDTTDPPGKEARRDQGDQGEDAVTDIYGFIRSRGYRFPDWLVTDYLLSLATKPLVLLCGISGTGKTKVAQLVAEFVAPRTVQSVVDSPERVLEDNEFVLTLTTKALDHISFAIPARVAPLMPWPQRGTGYDIDVTVDGQTLSGHVNNMAYNAQGESTGLNLIFKRDFRKWLDDNSVQAGDRLRVAVDEGEPPSLRATLVRGARTQLKTSSAHIAFISVRPDWTDNRSLLGYLNPLTGQYSPTELLRLLLHAQDNPDEPHFAILDEMNLAKVEYYFSDFLSAMESGTEMVLHDSADEVTVELDGTLVTVPRRLRIPRNVFFTGTVNVDETTYMFSPKVLDRANVIEFHDVDLRSYAAGVTAVDDSDFQLSEGVDLAALLKHPGNAYEWARPSDFAGLSASAKTRLLAIHDLLAQHNLHFGYRVANEVARFMNLVDKHVGPEVEAEALDMQLLQKVLPKLAGNAARLEQPLLELYADIAQADYPAAPGVACDLPRTAAKLGRMLESLRAVGFVSFVE